MIQPFFIGIYSGDGDCAAPVMPACDDLSPQDYYRMCHDQPGDESHSDVFRQVVTVFAAQ